MDALSRLTAEVTASEKASRFFTELNTSHIGFLSREYSRFSGHNSETSEAMCLAIELAVRCAATRDFTNPEVSEALATVERCKDAARRRKAAARRVAARKAKQAQKARAK